MIVVCCFVTIRTKGQRRVIVFDLLVVVVVLTAKSVRLPFIQARSPPLLIRHHLWCSTFSPMEWQGLLQHWR